MLAGFYGIEKDNRVAALGLIIHDRACQLAEKQATLNFHSEEKDEGDGEVKKTIDTFKVVIIACSVIIAIIIISIVFIILLKTRR